MVAARYRHPIPIRPFGFVGAALLVALLTPAAPAQAEPHDPTSMFLGSFCSEIQGDEYLYQDQIDLWREGPSVFGLAASSTGTFDRFEGTARGMAEVCRVQTA